MNSESIWLGALQRDAPNRTGRTDISCGMEEATISRGPCERPSVSWVDLVVHRLLTISHSLPEDRLNSDGVGSDKVCIFGNAGVVKCCGDNNLTSLRTARRKDGHVLATKKGHKGGEYCAEADDRGQ